MPIDKIKIIKEGISNLELPKDFEPLARKLTLYCQKKLGFENPPELFLKKDERNASDPLGQTAEYNPSKKSITIFVSGRHTKDILRSLAHELVHHQQNMRGDLTADKCGSLGPGYAQTNKHMRNMEKEAYLLGNIIFRDWEDHCKQQNHLKENNSMNKNKEIKVSKKLIKNLIQKVLKAKMNELHIQMRPGPANPVSVVGAECPKCGKVHEPQQTGCSACGDLGEGGDYPEVEGIIGEGDPLEAALDAAIGEGEVDDPTLGEGASSLSDIESIEAAVGEMTTPEEEDAQMSLPPEGQMSLEEGSKIETPEQESLLYESRFSSRNEQLFNKLSKLWTK